MEPSFAMRLRLLRVGCGLSRLNPAHRDNLRDLRHDKMLSSTRKAEFGQERALNVWESANIHPDWVGIIKSCTKIFRQFHGDEMKRTELGPAFAFVVLLLSAPSFAAAPDGPYGSNSHPAADMKWGYDGTRDALIPGLKHFFGREKNPFGPLAGGPEGVVFEGSEFLEDFVPAILGIPGPETKLPNGEYFYSGAEAHNATREAAVIAQGRGGEIRGVAVLQESYGRQPPVKQLTIFFPAGQGLDPAMESTFTGWARGEIDRSNAILKGSPSSQIIKDLVVKTRSIGA